MIDATPIARISGPAMMVRAIPAIAATPTAAPTPVHIARGLITPKATILGGPIRFSVSAPRLASDTSLAKLAATWIASAPTRAQAKASHRKAPSPTASPDPTATGTIAAVRVWMRAAVFQASNRLTGSVLPGKFAEVWRALLQEGVAALRSLIGHVGEPGGLTGKDLLAHQSVVDEVESELEHPL